MCECSKLSDIGERIKKLRENTIIDGASMTQAQLAKEFCVRREVITKWETGLQDLKTDNIIKLAHYFEVTTDYLLGLTPNKTNDIELGAICKYTGLSEDAINAIHLEAKSKNKNNQKQLIILSKLIDRYTLINLCYNLLMLINEKKHHNKIINQVKAVQSGIDNGITAPAEIFSISDALYESEKHIRFRKFEISEDINDMLNDFTDIIINEKII